MTEEQMTNEKPIIEHKPSFFFGLATGVAIVSLIGFIAFAGGMAKEDLDTSADTAPEKAAVKAVDSEPAPKLAAGQKVKVDVSSKDHFRGNKNAKVTIVTFSDIQCPYCSRFHETMKQVVEAYPNEVKWVLKHFPLENMHPFAKKSAEASECAAEQSKFWEYVDKLYENQGQLSEEFLKSLAGEVGLDTGKFDKCYASGKYRSKVEADFAAGKKLGVQGTPGSFINGMAVPGAVPFSDIDQYIKDEINK